MKPTCKIAILESCLLLSSGIKSLLKVSPEVEVIAEGISAESLYLQLSQNVPDVILIDLIHCSSTESRTVKKVRKYFPYIPLLLITGKHSTDYFNGYFSLDAIGFIFSDDSPEILIESIQRLCIDKEKYQDHVQKASVLTEGNRKKMLTDRELDVLKLFCNGLTYKKIGEALFISPRTVETHKKNILAKLEIRSTAEMVKYATLNKLISN